MGAMGVAWPRTAIAVLERVACVGATGLAMLVRTGAASAQIDPLDLNWEVVERYPTDPVNSVDEIADMAAWTDGSEHTWVYVTGYMTNDVGGHVIGVYRYDAIDGSLENFDLFPSDHLTTTKDHRGVSIFIDPDLGTPSNTRIYVAGYTTNGNDDEDYIVLKYDTALQRDTGSWSNTGYRTFDRGDGSDDVPADVLVAAAGANKYVMVVGTTFFQTMGDDITSVWFDAADGSLEGSDHYDGPGEGADVAVEATYVAGVAPEGDGPLLIVAGTSQGDGTGQDLVAILYDEPGVRGGEQWPCVGFGGGVRRYNGPDDGADVCTGVAHRVRDQSTSGYAILIGRTPRYPAYTDDTEMLLYSIVIQNGETFWDDDGYGEGARTLGSAAAGTFDTARDAVLLHDFGVLVTGDFDLDQDTCGIGVFLYSTEFAQHGLVSGSLFNDTAHSKDRAASITTDDLAFAYVTGSFISMMEQLPLRCVTLRFDLSDLSEPTHEAFHVGDLAAEGRKILLHAYGTRSRPLLPVCSSAPPRWMPTSGATGTSSITSLEA